jgi:hypothetical protein
VEKLSYPLNKEVLYISLKGKKRMRGSTYSLSPFCVPQELYIENSFNPHDNLRG